MVSESRIVVSKGQGVTAKGNKFFVGEGKNVLKEIVAMFTQL